MEVLTGLVAIVAVVLAVSGVLKVVDPQPTVDRLVALGGPGGRMAVLGLGLAEVTAGVVVLSLGGRVATAVVAGLYVAFAALTAVAMRRAPAGVSCGCFGRLSTPPSGLHVAVNLVSGAVAATAAVLDAPPLGDVLADQPLAGIPMLALVLLGAALTMSLTTVLADTLAATGADGRPPVRTLSFDPGPGDRP